MIEEKVKEPIAVIGAGLAGCVSAIYLAKAGYDVLLIEEKSEIMSVTSKIPVHLHSGGLYIKEGQNGGLDMGDAYHCLHDSINFMKSMPFAVVPRLTAFAVMSLSNTNIVAENKSQLLDEATELYRKESKELIIAKRNFYTSEDIFKEKLKEVDLLEIPREETENYEKKALHEQEKKWEIMQRGFAELKNKYKEIISLNNSDENKVFGEIDTFYECYSQEQFRQLKQEAQIINNDPSLDDKNGWAQQLARVTDPETIVGVVMSSELGLNMFRTNAAIQIELSKLEKEECITVLKNTKVVNISREGKEFALAVEMKAGENQKSNRLLKYTQVVNATGHQGKTFDLQLEHQIGWGIDVKGVGVVQLNGNTFCHVPEVYFTQAKGMCHFGRHNNSIAGVNFTTPYVEATYVTDGKATFSSEQPIILDEKLTNFLNTPITDSELLKRTERCIDGCTRFMPAFKNSVAPLAYLPGSLAFVGTDLSSRSSKEVYISEHGYHAVNIIKGGGVVSAAMALVQKVETYTIENHDKNHIPHFPNGSDSPITSDFVLTYEEMELDGKIQEISNELQMPDLNKAYQSYNSSK